MRAKHVAVLAVLALPAAACTVATPTASQADTNFVDTAYNLLQLDDQEGQLAAVQASDPRVKLIAGDLIAKTETFDPQLYQVIGTDNITPPASLSPQATVEVAALAPLTGTAFDKAYLADQIASHQHSIAVFQAEAQSPDPQLRQLAATGLPMVQDSLTKLRAINATL